MKEDKARKDAEAAERQAEAKRKAGEKAEERKRKQEAVSQVASHFVRRAYSLS